MIRFTKSRVNRSIAVLQLATIVLALNFVSAFGAETPLDVTQAIEQLAGRNSVKAADAAAWLQKHKYTAEELETLVESLGDERPAFPGPVYKDRYGDTSVCEFVKQVLIDMRSPAVPTMIKFLKSDAKPVAKVRCLEICFLLNIDAKEAFPTIAGLAKEPGDVSVRYHAYWALSMVTDDTKAIIAEFEPALRDKDPNIQSIVIQQLSCFRDNAKKFIPELVKFLDSDAQITIWFAPDFAGTRPLAADVAESLAGMGSIAAAALPKLSSKLHDKDPEVRLAAAYAHALISKDQDPGVTLLLKTVRSKAAEDQSAVVHAASYFFRMASKGEFDDVTDKVFRESIKHPESKVRMFAIRGIVALRPADALELLRPLAEEKETEENYFVVQDAKRAIGELNVAPFPKPPR